MMKAELDDREDPLAMLGMTVNDVKLNVGQVAGAESLQQAGLQRVAAWRHWLRRNALPGTHWKAADPTVRYFGGAVEIYPCRHSYLDPDRRWGTGCTVITRDGMIDRVEVRVIDGKYAAGNLFERFVEACTDAFGDAQHRAGGEARWLRDLVCVTATMADDAKNATFLIARDAG